MRKKLLFIYDSMMVGGTTTALLSLFNTIDQSKYEISLLLYSDKSSSMGDIPDFVHVLPAAHLEKKVLFLSTTVQKMIRTVFNGGLVKALISRYRHRGTPKGRLRTILMHYGMRAQVSLSRKVCESFDVAIGFMEGWSHQYLLSDKIKAAKKYVWIHPQYESCYLLPEIDKPFFEQADGIALVAENCLPQFSKFFPTLEAKVRIVPNILSTELVCRKAKSQTVFVKSGKINLCTVCRCDVKVKGLDRMLRALSELKKEGYGDGVVWHLIGDGQDFNGFKESVKKCGLEDQVILYGNKQNPLPYLLQMDMFVLVSRYEGKPISVTEAQILGLPCFVTNYASASSQVKNGYNGLVVENDYASIYEGLKEICTDEQLLDNLKQNAKLCKFGNETDIAKFYDLLDMN